MLQYRSTSNGDEFVRVGERLRAEISFYDAVNLLWHDSQDDALAKKVRQDPSKLQLSLKVTYTKFDDARVEAPAPARHLLPRRGAECPRARAPSSPSRRR